MASGHECYHCKQWIEAGVEHDCWTTTEEGADEGFVRGSAGRLGARAETAADLGEQRIYASHNSIMFARKACYFFVRPKRTRLELCIFLGRTIKSPLVRKTVATSRTKVAHLVNVVHRDQVEAPLTEWIEEAYGLQDVAAAGPSKRTKEVTRSGKRTPKRRG